MKIIIDARMITWTGIGRYTWNLLDQLQDIDHSNQYIVLLLAKDFEGWQPKAANFTKQLADIRPYSLAEQILLPITLYRLRPDLVHFPHFTAPPLYFGRRVATIHDLTLVSYKTNQGEGAKKILYELKYWGMRLVLRCAIMRSRLITDTEFVRQQIISRYEHSPFKISPSKVTTTLLSVDPLFASPKKPAFAVGGDYLLYVGNYYPNKNIGRLLKAFKLAQASNPNLELVLTGKADYFQGQLQLEAQRLGLSNKVIFAGFVSDSELVWLYKHAKAFVFPSLSEGFGLPALEAMSQGTPVLAAHASCLPEVCGEAAVYFDPLDTADMAAKICAVLDDKKQLERLRLAGPEHIKLFSWRRMAEQTLAIYREFE